MNYRQNISGQKGAVSILTVLMFSILIGILLTGFTRLVIQEKRDSLQDALSKGAYSSAQVGVEEARRALQYCSDNPGTDIPGFRCSNLYNTECPGFNTLPGGAPAFSGLGIGASSGGGTSIGEPGANQRYTCVIISPNDNIETRLGDTNTTSNTAMYQIQARNNANYNRIEVSWHGASDGTRILPPLATVSNLGGNGNIRQPDWQYPAVLRMTLIAAEDDLATTPVSKTTFMYPTNGAGGGPGQINFGSINSSTFVDCSMTALYACTQTFLLPPGGVPPNRFIMLQSFYKATSVAVKLMLGSNDVPMTDAQTTIDSTGAAGGVFRRVQVQVAPGKPVASGTALDVGNSVCKDFFVSAETYDNVSCD